MQIKSIAECSINDSYSKTCIKNSHPQKVQKFVFKTNYRLMQVKSIAECSKWSILLYFRPSLSYHLSLRSLFCLFWPLSKRPKIGFQDQLLLNAGQKYCRMLQGEYFAILLIFIKLPFVIKIFVLSILATLKNTKKCFLRPIIAYAGQKYCKMLQGEHSAILLFCLFCCFTSQVNSYGHCGTVSSPNHTFSWAGLNKWLTSNSCTYFRL